MYAIRSYYVSRQKRDNKLYLKLDDLLREKKLLAEDFDLVFVDNVVGRAFVITSYSIHYTKLYDVASLSLPHSNWKLATLRVLLFV